MKCNVSLNLNSMTFFYLVQYIEVLFYFCFFFPFHTNFSNQKCYATKFAETLPDETPLSRLFVMSQRAAAPLPGM